MTLGYAARRFRTRCRRSPPGGSTPGVRRCPPRHQGEPRSRAPRHREALKLPDGQGHRRRPHDPYRSGLLRRLRPQHPRQPRLSRNAPCPQCRRARCPCEPTALAGARRSACSPGLARQGLPSIIRTYVAMSVEGNAARFGAEKNLVPSPIWAPMRVRACLTQSKRRQPPLVAEACRHLSVCQGGFQRKHQNTHHGVGPPSKPI